jgi:GntR family transcriptional regulator
MDTEPEVSAMKYPDPSGHAPSHDQELHANAIDRSSAIPIYHQIYEHLRDQILAGRWKTGEMIDPEPVLMQRYQVSRITVRQALERLVNENLIYRQRGQGSFVNNPQMKTNAVHMVDLDEDARRRGLTTSTLLLENKLAAASRHTASLLGIEEGDELAILHRLHLGDGEPLSLEYVHLVHRYCPGILDKADFSSASVKEVLRTVYNIRIVRSINEVSAMVASNMLAETLRLRGNMSLLYVERVSYSQLNIPVEQRRIYYRADRYKLQYESST